MNGKKLTEQLVTKTQLETIMTAWATAAEVPAKGKKVFVCWPNKEHAEITYTDKRSEYGQRLYRIEFFQH